MRKKTEQRIREAVRAELEREKRLKSLAPEVQKVQERIWRNPFPWKPGNPSGVDGKISEIDWPLLIDDIIKAYWKVVEEEVNGADFK